MTILKRRSPGNPPLQNTTPYSRPCGRETLALPDQPGQARAALATFAKLDGQGPERLLGGRFTRFDLRLPGRMIVAGPAVAETLAEAEKARRAAAQAQKI